MSKKTTIHPPLRKKPTSAPPIAAPRAITKPLPVEGGRLEIDLDGDPAEVCSNFLELVARVIRSKKKITIIIE